jgi:hypothetical protein
MRNLLTHCRISHAIIIVPFLIIVAPIRRKHYRLPSRSQYGEGQDEIDYLSATIQSSGHDVVVLDKPIWSVLAKVELRDDSDGVVEEQGAVCAMREDACIIIRIFDGKSM